MPVSIRIAVVLLLLSMAAPGAAQTNDSWLNSLPSIADVEADIVYDDEVSSAGGVTGLRPRIR